MAKKSNSTLYLDEVKSWTTKTVYYPYFQDYWDEMDKLKEENRMLREGVSITNIFIWVWIEPNSFQSEMQQLKQEIDEKMRRILELNEEVSSIITILVQISEISTESSSIFLVMNQSSICLLVIHHPNIFIWTVRKFVVSNRLSLTFKQFFQNRTLNDMINMLRSNQVSIQ